MKKHKFRVPSWDEGDTLMKNISSSLGLSIDQNEENQRIENSSLTVTCHHDERAFSYFVVKIRDQSLEENILDLIKKYID